MTEHPKRGTSASPGDESDAYKLLEDRRWPDGVPVCPHCESTRKPYFLKPANDTSRRTRTGSCSERRVWKCAECRKQFSVLTGTIFEGTKIPVSTLVMALGEDQSGATVREVARRYRMTPRTAWFMLLRLPLMDAPS